MTTITQKPHPGGRAWVLTSGGVVAQRYVSTGKGSDNAVLISSTASSRASTPSLTRWSISFVNSSVCSYSANVAMVACSVGELAFLLTSRASAPAATTDSAARAARAARVCAGRILTNSSPLRSRLLACIDECRYTVDPIDLRTCFAESRLQTVRWMIARCALRIHALRQPRHIPMAPRCSSNAHTANKILSWKTIFGSCF